MNTPILLAALIMVAAIIGHLLIGTRETATLEPETTVEKRMQHWVQTMSAFQMLTLDLIVMTGLLFVIALTDWIGIEAMLIPWIAGYFLLQGLIWITCVLWLRRPGVTLLSLPHWAAWFVCAGLIWMGG